MKRCRCSSVSKNDPSLHYALKNPICAIDESTSPKEEGFTQKTRQTVVVAFLGKMAAHLDLRVYSSVADKLRKVGRASNTLTYEYRILS